MSNQFFKQTLTILLAGLLLLVGRGYGLLTHTCDQHGQHSHVLMNTETTQTCEHDSHAHQHSEHQDGFNENSDEETVFQYINLQTETLAKIHFFAIGHYLPVSIACAVQCIFLGFEPKLKSSTKPPFLRQRYGRQLLAWVQSFLI